MQAGCRSYGVALSSVVASSQLMTALLSPRVLSQHAPHLLTGVPGAVAVGGAGGVGVAATASGAQGGAAASGGIITQRIASGRGINGGCTHHFHRMSC